MCHLNTVRILDQQEARINSASNSEQRNRFPLNVGFIHSVEVGFSKQAIYLARIMIFSKKEGGIVVFQVGRFSPTGFYLF